MRPGGRRHPDRSRGPNAGRQGPSPATGLPTGTGDVEELQPDYRHSGQVELDLRARIEGVREVLVHGRSQRQIRPRGLVINRADDLGMVLVGVGNEVQFVVGVLPDPHLVHGAPSRSEPSCNTTPIAWVGMVPKELMDPWQR